MSHCALILAGGKGRRMGFQEKALIDINGSPLISCVTRSLERGVDNIIISVRDTEQGDLLSEVMPGYRYAYDTYESKGPIAGILSGLQACSDEFCFIAACDMPYINGKVVEMLFRESEGYDAAIPRHEDGFLEPLHAVYKCSPMIRETRKAIERGENIILAPVFKLNVNYIDMDKIRKIDPELRTFMNINTPEDIREVTRNKRNF